MHYRVILLRIFEDGRISNQTSIHPTYDNALHYAKGALLTGSADGFSVIKETSHGWNVLVQQGLGWQYMVTETNGLIRIERTSEAA